jgi:methyltransferase
MTGTQLAWIVIGLVAMQRLSELPLARRNTRALIARGAVEIGAGHYPLIVLLHGLWLAAILLLLPHPTPVHWPLLLLFILLQFLRAWVIVTLGIYWTTRIISLPGAPLVRRGPFRLLRHPNYLAVAGEIAVLPLVFGEVWVAIGFSAANAAVLVWRIHLEDIALAPRREGAA